MTHWARYPGRPPLATDRENDVSAPALLVGLFFIVIPTVVIIGLYIFARFYQKRSKENVPDFAKDWRAVTARITAAGVEETVRDRRDDDASYYPSIQFEYTHGNRMYKGTLAVGRPHTVISHAWETLSRYPVGKEITIYCNPDHPGESRLWIK
jgi:hypothetical protein